MHATIKFGRWLLLAGLLALGIPETLSAQGVIEGSVVDRTTRRPLAGVQVFIEQLGLGGLTAPTGRFRLQNVPPGSYTITARFIGYSTATQTVTVGATEPGTVNFEMSETALALDEIVVTGTPGGQQRRAIGNVVERMDASARTEIAPAININQLMSQAAPGVYLSGMPGMVGTGTAVRIRGVSSLALGAQPLLYVDGVRVDNNASAGPNLRGGGQSARMNDFNPEDIESIEIIKGPAAATLYGTEASNGVIQIITKRGSSGAPSFELVTRQGANWLPDQEERQFWTYFYDPAKGVVTDSMNIFTRYRERREAGIETQGPLFITGHLQSYTASVRGGTDLVRYYSSVDWDDEVGILDYNWNKKFSTRANVSVHPGSTWDLNVSLGFVRSHTRFGQAATGFDIWSFIVWTRPDQCEGPTRCFRYAPPEVGALVDSRTRFNRFTGSFQVNHRPTSWLSQRIQAGLDFGSDVSSQLFPRVPEGETNFFGANGVGFKQVDNINTLFNSLDWGATATFDLASDLNSATSVGVQYYARQNHRTRSEGSNFPSPAITTVGGASSKFADETWLENKTLGTYIQQQLSWRDRVFLTAAVRGDDNSAFGADFEAALYPKFSATWVVSDEPFWRVAYLDQLRLRMAWGQAGMQPGVLDAVTLYRPDTGAGGQPVLTPRTLGNTGLKPEVGSETEVGFDASFAQDRVSLQYTYYDKSTKDALIPQQVRPSAGFPGTQMVNLGLVSNWGHELAVATKLLDRRNFGLDLGVNLSTQQSRIEDMGGIPTPPGSGTRNRVGYPINTFFAEKALSGELRPGTTTAINMMCDGGRGPYGHSMGGDPVPCSQAPVVAWGQVQPTWTTSITTGVRLGADLLLNSVIEAQGGHIGNSMIGGAHRTMNSTKAVNPIVDPRIAYYLTQGNNNVPALFRAGFARWRELALSYNLPQALVSGTGAQRANISLGWRNVGFLWVEEKEIWGSRVFDPEQTGAGDNRTVSQVTELPPTSQLIATLRVMF